MKAGDVDARAALRRALRRRRANEPPETRAENAARIAAHLLARPGVFSLKAVAAYVADEGEPDLEPFLEAVHRRGVALYLPAPVGRALRFLRWSPGTPLRIGRFGIPIPEGEEAIAPTDLDWVLVPLVAFTARGQRLGRGGGFYDRTFARRVPAHPPLLVGIAYVWQEVDRLARSPWDVDLDAIVTPEGWRECAAAPQADDA
jgi:5-formyltetrahydrofolate cyclo-ligase